MPHAPVGAKKGTIIIIKVELNLIRAAGTIQTTTDKLRK
jgi:hypothetical protein